MLQFFLHGACQPPGSRRRRPPASWTGLTSSWDTVGMLGHVFDHQPPLTRPLQAVDAACSTTIVCKYCQKSMKINGNQWKPMEIYENQWKSMKTNGNLWKSLILSSSRRRRRPPGVARASPDDQTQCLTSPQCHRIMLWPSSRPGDAYGGPRWPTGAM